MPDITLPVDAGRPVGSRSSRRLLGAGKIPAVVYGHGIEPVPVAVDARALRAALTTEAGTNALLQLQLDGGSELVMAREIQRHPVRGTVVHVDFLVVRRDEVVSAEVPVNLVGEATAVEQGDGVVEQQLFQLTVHATPDRIPTGVEVDVSGLAIGDSLRVGDLQLPEGVTADLDPEVPVVVGQPPQVMREDVEADEEAAAAAGEEPGTAAGGPPTTGEDEG